MEDKTTDSQEKARKILYKKNATREELRDAIADLIGEDYSNVTNVIAAQADEQKTQYQQCLSCFTTAYKKQTGLKYSFTARDGKALKEIIQKVTDLIADNASADVSDTFKLIIDLLPKWWRENAFELSIINSKFNQIIQQIKKENAKQRITDYEERTIRDCFNIR